MSIAVTPPDPWQMAAWKTLPDVCLIGGCNGESGIDERGPVYLRDDSMWKACIEHWEAIMRILGKQASWERTDAAFSPRGAAS